MIKIYIFQNRKSISNHIVFFFSLVKQVKHRSKRLRSLSWENFTEPCQLLTTYPFITNSSQKASEFIQQLYRNRLLLSPSISSSSSTSTSCSSETTHCSFSTSGSWTLDLVSQRKKEKAI